MGPPEAFSQLGCHKNYHCFSVNMLKHPFFKTSHLWWCSHCGPALPQKEQKIKKNRTSHQTKTHTFASRRLNFGSTLQLLLQLLVTPVQHDTDLWKAHLDLLLTGFASCGSDVVVKGNHMLGTCTPVLPHKKMATKTLQMLRAPVVFLIKSTISAWYRCRIFSWSSTKQK